LLDKEAMIKVGDLLAAQDFYKDGHRLIYQCMADLFSNREPIDILSLANLLEERKQLEKIGGRAYLVSLSNIVPSASHVENYARIIQKKATLRRLLEAATQITSLGYTEHEDVAKVLDEAEQRLFTVSQGHTKQSFTPIKDVLSDAFERIDTLHKERGKLRGVPTGFAALDNLLAGLQRSDLVILAARPSVGKTSLALDIARGAATVHKVPVGLFSLEMSKEQLVDRLICAEARVDLWKMRTGKLSDRPGDEDFPRIGHALGLLSESPIYIDDSPSANIMEIRTKARRLQMEHGLGLLVIDYLQLMESRGGGSDNRVQEVAEITRGLKGIARELNIPVLALSQLARAVEMNKPAIPRLAHLRESGCLIGETKIQLANGERRSIRELAERSSALPTQILGLNDKWQIVKAEATKVFPSGKKAVFELSLRSGKKITASANHPFQKLEGWTRLDQLKIGDRLAMPRRLNITSRKRQSDAALTLLAHLLGDGCILPHQPYHYTSADRECLNAVSKAAKELFGISARWVRQKNWWHLYLPAPFKLARGKVHPITTWFESLGIAPVHAPEKRIPDAIMQEPPNRIALFLRHLWSTDGNISRKLLTGRKPSAAIYYSSTSHELAEQVQHLLLRVGIWSTLRTVPQKPHRPSHQVHIQGKDQQLRFLTLVGAIGKRDLVGKKLITDLLKINPNTNLDIIPVEIWREQIVPRMEKTRLTTRALAKELQMSYSGTALYKSSIGRARLAKLAAILTDDNLKALAESDVYWDKIVAIKSKGQQETYDLSVPGIHNFIANDIVVHNSIEQDADVVMFIYRKAADKNYQIDDIPPEERALAEIHIAKHRNGPTGVVQLFFDAERACFRNLDKQYANVPHAEAQGTRRGDMAGNVAPF
ncbi:MAG: replicative DNA helicase, partial [bacterium]